MSAYIEPVSSRQQHEIAEDLARLEVVTQGLEEEVLISSTGVRGKGVSQSGKGGNQTTFNTAPQVTSATVLAGIAKTFLAATPQGKFNLLKQLGVPVEEMNISLGYAADSTAGVDSPQVGNYFLEIAKAMNASNNGNNASITAMLQQIAEKKQELSSVSTGLQQQADSAQTALTKAHSEAHESFWDKIGSFFTDNWKMLVITVAVTIATALVPAACAALSAAIGPIFQIGVDTAAAADAAATAAENAANIAKTAKMVASAANVVDSAGIGGGGVVNALQDGASMAEKAADIAKQALQNCKECIINGDESNATAWKSVAEKAKTLAQYAEKADATLQDAATTARTAIVDGQSVTENVITAPKTVIQELKTELQTLEESVKSAKAADAVVEGAAKDASKLVKLGRYFSKLGPRAQLEKQIAQDTGKSAVKAVLQQGLNKLTFYTGVAGAGLDITVGALTPGAADLIPAELQVINSDTQVLTNQAQIINMDISTDQTQINNFNDRDQADSQMVQQIISQMSQVFAVRLN